MLMHMLNKFLKTSYLRIVALASGLGVPSLGYVVLEERRLEPGQAGTVEGGVLTGLTQSSTWPGQGREG